MANQNNQDRPQTISTRGYQTSNPNAIKATAFEWSYQGEMLKIIISPELPENEQTEKRRYDYDHSWITCISRVKCLELYNQINSLIIPSMEKKTDSFVSVPVADVNQFGIGVKFKDGECTGYVKLIRNINPTDLISKDEIIYEFKKGESIINYDNETGKFQGRELNETEMYLFISDLESFVRASSKAFNHANRVVDKTFKEQVTSMIRAIANKVGAEIPTYNSAQRSGAKYGASSLFDNNAAQAPSGVITSLDDIKIPME